MKLHFIKLKNKNGQICELQTFKKDVSLAQKWDALKKVKNNECYSGNLKQNAGIT